MEPKIKLIQTIITKVFEVRIDGRVFKVKQIDKGENQIITYEVEEDLGNNLRPRIYKLVSDFDDKLEEVKDNEK